jgi:hypothetical protein
MKRRERGAASLFPHHSFLSSFLIRFYNNAALLAADMLY